MEINIEELVEQMIAIKEKRESAKKELKEVNELKKELGEILQNVEVEELKVSAFLPEEKPTSFEKGEAGELLQELYETKDFGRRQELADRINQQRRQEKRDEIRVQFETREAEAHKKMEEINQIVENFESQIFGTRKEVEEQITSLIEQNRQLQNQINTKSEQIKKIDGAYDKIREIEYENIDGLDLAERSAIREKFKMITEIDELKRQILQNQKSIDKNKEIYIELYDIVDGIFTFPQTIKDEEESWKKYEERKKEQQDLDEQEEWAKQQYEQYEDRKQKEKEGQIDVAFNLKEGEEAEELSTEKKNFYEDVVDFLTEEDAQQEEEHNDVYNGIIAESNETSSSVTNEPEETQVDEQKQVGWIEIKRSAPPEVANVEPNTPVTNSFSNSTIIDAKPLEDDDVIITSKSATAKIENITFSIINESKPCYTIIIKDKKGLSRKIVFEGFDKIKLVNSAQAKDLKEDKGIEEASKYYDLGLAEILEEIDKQYGTNGLHQYNEMHRLKLREHGAPIEDALSIDYDFSELYKKPVNEENKAKIKSLIKLVKAGRKVANPIASFQKAPGLFKKFLNLFRLKPAIPETTSKPSWQEEMVNIYKDVSEDQGFDKQEFINNIESIEDISQTEKDTVLAEIEKIESQKHQALEEKAFFESLKVNGAVSQDRKIIEDEELGIGEDQEER